MTALAERIAREFGTPAVVIDLDRVERNIARVQAACDAAGLRNRPHIKTHKSPVIARLQRDAGAQGITCQKLGEAEIMAAAGLDDILISYNILGEHKLDRLGALLRSGVGVTVAADNPVTVAGLPRAAALAERPLPVVVECDTGRKRAGVETPGEAIALARDIASRPGLVFAGLMLYGPEDGVAGTQAFLDEAKAGLREAGLEAGIVSNGGTPNLKNLTAVDGVTEHRAGTYVFNDRMMLACGAATPDDVALHVVSTVVSRAGTDRGSWTPARRPSRPTRAAGSTGTGSSWSTRAPASRAFAEEHGFLDLSGCNDRPEVGDVVRIVPNHVCVVVNMVDRLVAVRGGEIVGEIEVAARGRLG
jgi:D-serine deaminase-like pyridoxal phosphate-dependent protein